MRKHLASLIRLHFPKPRGGKQSRSDVDFFIYVSGWCSQEPFTRAAERLRRETGELPCPTEVWEALSTLFETLTIEDGLEHVIETGALGISPDAEINGLRKKYARGRTLV
jgi:hypothetical protein